jgi:hypothetical protein
MTRTWVSIVSAALGLVSLLLFFRPFSRNDAGDGEAASGRDRLAARDGKDDRAASAAAAVRARLAGHRGGGQGEDSFDAPSEPDSIADAVSRARGRAVTGAANPVRDHAAALGQEDPSLDTAAAALAPKPDSAQAGGTASGSETGAGPATTPGSGDDDPNGPVVSLKFDKSTIVDEKGNAVLVENGITFDANGAHFSSDAQLAIPHVASVTGQAGTVTFSILPDWAGDLESNASFFQLRGHTWENRISIFKNGQYLRFLICDNTGQESGVGVSIADWKKDASHAVAATWGDHVTALYVDGISKGSNEYNGELEIPEGTPLMIGSDHPGGAGGAGGSLPDFQIYSRALSPDEVLALAAQSRH